MKHEHHFERFELVEPEVRFGDYLRPAVIYYVGYRCECGEMGYRVPDGLL